MVLVPVIIDSSTYPDQKWPKVMDSIPLLMYKTLCRVVATQRRTLYDVREVTSAALPPRNVYNNKYITPDRLWSQLATSSGVQIPVDAGRNSLIDK